MTGFVYLLANESMPDLYKIGFTRRTPQHRVEELSAPSGLPTPFELLCAVQLPDALRFERRMHLFFWDSRVSQSREFFRFGAPGTSLGIAMGEMMRLNAISYEVTPAADKYLARDSDCRETHQYFMDVFAEILEHA